MFSDRLRDNMSTRVIGKAPHACANSLKSFSAMTIILQHDLTITIANFYTFALNSIRLSRFNCITVKPISIAPSTQAMAAPTPKFR